MRFYGELTDLADEVDADVPFGGPRSVKDLVEALGVPHPEVGLIVVDGSTVGFDHRLTGGERIAVYPPFHDIDVTGAVTVWPQPIAPRFVLDVHLGTLARRLRLLGFDCWYRTDTDDAELARIAVDERRILLTRDRGLLMRRIIVHGYCPRSHDPDEQVIEVVRRYELAEQTAPMTRCATCNGRLAAVDRAAVHDQLPTRTAAAFDDFARCEGCGQLYWSGAHAESLEAIVRRIDALR